MPNSVSFIIFFIKDHLKSNKEYMLVHVLNLLVHVLNFGCSYITLEEELVM